VPLAEGGGTVAVEAQHLGNRGDVVRDLAGVAGESRSGLDDAAHVGDMVVAPALDRRAGRRADGGSVEVVVEDPLVGEPVEGRGGDGAAEEVGAREAEVVDQDENHIRGALRRIHHEARRRCRVAHVELGVVRTLRLGDRQYQAVELRLG